MNKVSKNFAINNGIYILNDTVTKEVKIYVIIECEDVNKYVPFLKLKKYKDLHFEDLYNVFKLYDLSKFTRLGE